ncbi:hypothetical protein BC792_12726 [Sphingobacterium allocomposti]|uniref:Uncharacterized protein n=2 Tax=Sphingobacterium allocomposti TaxID=415956 RepID=A0A5S5D0Y7_9SPHI|nr:hypothetical protein BC792_12726 [Sphingobacterium composti Yoo et al. 2007 non Ten et al. 2007]
MWALGLVAKKGLKITDINDNPFHFIPLILHAAACNASGRDESAYDEGMFWDFVDEVGVGHGDIAKAITCLTNSLGSSAKKEVPKTSKKAPTTK